MKVGIISDSHGNLTLLKKTVEKMGEVDLYIHLGDFVKDAKTILEDSGKKYFVVKGNCDLEDVEEDIVTDIEGEKFFITHGHQYNIKYGYNNIYYRALEWEADVVLFGHTHKPVCIWYGGILFFNPGSTSLPRGGSDASYGIIEIEDGDINPFIYEV